MHLNTVTTAVLVTIGFGSVLLLVERRRVADLRIGPTAELARVELPVTVRVAAAGRVEGLTPNVELRPRISEQIKSIVVQEGDWVRAGDLLVLLDGTRHAIEQQLAAAEVAMAEAKLQRVLNGYRESEIDEARNDHGARLAELDGAERDLDRLERLVAANAASWQELDDRRTRVRTLERLVAAAGSRLATLEAPPREDDVNAARAAVAASQARLSMANENLARTMIRAPIDGEVLQINAEVGELTGPDQSLPLVVMADTRTLRIVADVDEYDAMTVGLGQRAEVKNDSVEGVLARGVVCEVEPLMQPKEIFSDRPGERLDSFRRRIRITLEDPSDLPIGLPVDVFIEVPVEGKLPAEGKRPAVTARH